MDTIRYLVAVAIVVTIPPAVAYWYVAHPLAPLLRRLGPAVSLVLLLGMFGLAVAFLLQYRDTLVGADLGWHLLLALPAAFLYGISIKLEVNTRKYLKINTLVGVPEFSGAGDSNLLHEGIYAQVRHPRYLAIMVGTAGWALFANYAGPYVVALLLPAALYGVTVLEERELLHRVPEYGDYRARVPRFVPRR